MPGTVQIQWESNDGGGWAEQGKDQSWPQGSGPGDNRSPHCTPGRKCRGWPRNSHSSLTCIYSFCGRELDYTHLKALAV